MAKGSGVSAGSVIKWTLIAAVVYVVYRLVVGWTAGLAASGATGSTTPVSSGSYASPGGYTSPISGNPMPVSGYGFNPLPSAGGTVAPGGILVGPLPLPIVSRPFSGRLI